MGGEEADLVFFGEVVQAYVALGWNPLNIGNLEDGMLSFFIRHELPSVNKRKTNTDEPASWAPLRKWAEEEGIEWQASPL